jgi:hypothetical protein
MTRTDTYQTVSLAALQPYLAHHEQAARHVVQACTNPVRISQCGIDQVASQITPDHAFTLPNESRNMRA